LRREKKHTVQVMRRPNCRSSARKKSFFRGGKGKREGKKKDGAIGAGKLH